MIRPRGSEQTVVPPTNLGYDGHGIPDISTLTPSSGSPDPVTKSLNIADDAVPTDVEATARETTGPPPEPDRPVRVPLAVRRLQGHNAPGLKE